MSARDPYLINCADHPHFRAYISLVAVCFFWGTTYLGIRIALESMPPLALVAVGYASWSRLIDAALGRRKTDPAWPRILNSP